MTTLREAAQQAKQAPLRELLASVPADARLVIDDADGKGTRCIPVGRLCREAAAALAEPCPSGDRPAAQCPGEWETGCDLGNNPKYAKRVDLAEPVQEPIAMLWQHRETGRPRLLMPNERTATDVAYAWDVVGPLYLAPPQRKPEPNSDYERGFVDGMSEQARRSVDKAVNAMTKCKPLAEEEIARLVTNDMVKFARAIERAHGIKE